MLNSPGDEMKHTLKRKCPPKTKKPVYTPLNSFRTFDWYNVAIPSRTGSLAIHWGHPTGLIPLRIIGRSASNFSTLGHLKFQGSLKINNNPVHHVKIGLDQVGLN